MAILRASRVRLDVVEVELTDVNRRLERLFEALESGKLALDGLSPRIQFLRHRQDQLRAARDEVQDLLAERRVALRGTREVVKYVDDMRSPPPGGKPHGAEVLYPVICEGDCGEGEGGGAQVHHSHAASGTC